MAATANTTACLAGASQILINGEPIYRDSTESMRSERDILPDGMDVSEALLRCEDPTLGWSLQFWITIANPVDGHVFFACPATGQTSWTPPQGVFVVPRQPEGEWWELADITRGNRSYFYNTMTKKTQWTRPDANQFVIPLGLIQSSASPDFKRRSRQISTASARIPHLRANDPSSPLLRTRHSSQPHGAPSVSLGPRPPPSPSPRRSRTSGDIATASSLKTAQPVAVNRKLPPGVDHTQSDPSSPHSDGAPVTPPAGPGFPRALSVVGESEEGADRGTSLEVSESGNEADQSVVSNFSERSDRTLRSAGVLEARGGAKSGETRFEEKRKTSGGFLGILGRPGRVRASSAGPTESGQENIPPGLRTPPWVSQKNASSVTLGRNASPTHPGRMKDLDVVASFLPRGKPLAPIPIDIDAQSSTLRSKRMSTGFHPLLPAEVTTQIQHFQTEDFAARYFATRRSGLWRQKLPLERVMLWQKVPITSPLLNSSKDNAKEAIMCFKVIQRTMGERDRPIEGLQPSRAPGLRSGPSGSALHLPRDAKREARNAVLEEIRWMIQTCIAKPELKDEVYCQVIKQVKKNPDHDATVLGFQLLCVTANAFVPRSRFEPFVKSFLENKLDEVDGGIDIMARYCLTKMEKTSHQAIRGRALTDGEIEHASDAAFYPSMYGEPLGRVMRQQAASRPDEKVPIVLPFLAGVILRLKGLELEGIFRIPGDSESVAEIKSRIDRGKYELAESGIEDAHVVASLLKLWLRELEDPLIPAELYNDALRAASSEAPQAVIHFVRRLPTQNRRVLIFVIAFLQLFCRDEVVAVTMMTPPNLALIFAPNILRTTSESLITVYNNSGFESRFVLLLLQHLDTKTIDPGYQPELNHA